MPDYLVQADGISRFTLADGSSFLLLATEAVEGRAIRVKWQSPPRRTKWAVTRRVRWRRTQ